MKISSLKLLEFYKTDLIHGSMDHPHNDLFCFKLAFCYYLYAMFENRSAVVWVGETGISGIFSKRDTDYRENIHAVLRREDPESFVTYVEIAVLLIDLMNHDAEVFGEMITQIREQVLDFPI